MLSNLVLKHPPCIFLPVFFKKRTKIIKTNSCCFTLLHSLCILQYFVLVFLRNKVQTSLKKYRGRSLILLNSKAHRKIQALFLKKKKTSPEKYNLVSLGPSQTIIHILTGKLTKVKTIACPMRPISRK